jgi:hypothetical protein
MIPIPWADGIAEKKYQREQHKNLQIRRDARVSGYTFCANAPI